MRTTHISEGIAADVWEAVKSREDQLEKILSLTSEVYKSDEDEIIRQNLRKRSKRKEIILRVER